MNCFSVLFPHSLRRFGSIFIILGMLSFPLGCFAAESDYVEGPFTETSVVIPSNNFKENANVQSFAIFEEAAQNREAFWAKQAECLDWFRSWDKVLEWNPPYAKWFVGGKLNACYNCLERHMKTAVRKKIALIWEGERGEERAITYEELYKEVNKFSNVLKSFGIQKGDKVAIYLPMVPEAVVAMLSCARIGAVHTVIFAGFSADSLKDRILDARAKLLITADGGFRKGKIVPLKETADLALEGVSSIQKVVVLKHTGHPVTMQDQRDYWYDQLMNDALPECPRFTRSCMNT